MKVYYKRREFRFDESMSALKLLKKLSLSANEVVVVKNGTIVTEDEMLSRDDEVKIINTVSGG